jgi:hypothetical protein
MSPPKVHDSFYNFITAPPVPTGTASCYKLFAQSASSSAFCATFFRRLYLQHTIDFFIHEKSGPDVRFE